MNRSRFRTVSAIALASAVASAAGGCNTFSRLSDVGAEPQMSAVSNPVAQPGYRPVSLPMPAPMIAEENPSSLWRPGAKAFFKDIRAKDVGDILTVQLSLDDKASLNNATNRQREASESTQLDALLGFENPVKGVFKRAEDPSNLLDFGSTSETDGDGDIDRSEQIDLKVAAVVTQVLPNGSLAIMGRQELRVNYELRELMVQGIIRPQDIEADNTISHEKIAEMRLAYGGRGTLSDLQQPRWGTQVWDILAPF
ncbi:MAG: flagellar basal body L-ring protein FlgH [Rhodospirillales bacterium]|nr:flagellar basal body L-ring protein FlgH [Rhodospirillales bacterium]